MAELDLAKVMRVLSAAQEAAEGPEGGRPSIRYLYYDLRDEARAAVSGELHEEFDSLFPGRESGEPVGMERVRALAGWLNGIVQHATLDRRIQAEAEAVAKERAKAERGVGFS